MLKQSRRRRTINGGTDEHEKFSNCWGYGPHRSVSWMAGRGATPDGPQADPTAAQLLLSRDVSASADERPERCCILSKQPNPGLFDARELVETRHRLHHGRAAH